MPRTTPSKRNKKTSARRNIGLEKKYHKVGSPPGFGIGMGSKVLGGQESLIVENFRTGKQVRVKGKQRKLKENVARAVTKSANLKFEPADKFRKRMRSIMKEEERKTKPPRVPVKSRGRARGGMRGGGIGSGPFGPRIR